MKRAADQLTNGAPTSGKRSNNNDTDAAEESEPSNLFVLTSQNRALGLELMTYKRSITEGRKELDLMRRKSREMEALVSLIQRAWSQLDIDSSMLLDSLGDSDVNVPDSGSSELLHRLIHAGSQYLKLDPTNQDNLPKLNVDQWSSSEEIENEKNQLEAKLLENRHILNSEFGGLVEDNLAAHASFTLSLLERLCNAINDNCQQNGEVNASLNMKSAEQVNSIAQTKEFHAEKLMLNDRITKLTAEIITLNAKLKICENEKLRVTRKLDKSQLAIKDLEQKGSTSGAGATVEGVAAETNITVSSAVTGSENNGGQATVSAAQVSAEKELKRQIVVLERQLTESETAKSKVEMTLTERLARPLSQTETQVADMRRSMEELRQQCKLRVASLIAEGDALQDKVKNLEAALMQVEAVSKVRLEELMSITEKEIAAVRAQKDALQATLFSTQADLAVTNQLKTQLTEYQAMEGLCNSEVKKLQNELKMMTDTQAMLRQHLAQSKERELLLESQLLQKQCDGDNKAENKSSSAAPSVSAQHLADLQQELEDARSNINDFISEIEAVAAEEVKARNQSGRLLRQIAEYQSMQRVALEENLRLSNQIEDIKSKYTETEQKMDLMRSVMQQQESLLAQIRQSEQGVRVECQTMKKSTLEESASRHIEEQKLLEAKQKLVDSEHSINSALKRNQELQKRCDELSSQCESERKARLEAQREAAKIKNSRKERAAEVSSSGTSGGGSSEDSDMLEMTLGMLRCSVCKDRFKSVAITRCFHLFCKECIDENLRNRHRKCPACGEKFGQDDVTNIFFTN